MDHLGRTARCEGGRHRSLNAHESKSDSNNRRWVWTRVQAGSPLHTGDIASAFGVPWQSCFSKVVPGVVTVICTIIFGILIIRTGGRPWWGDAAPGPYGTSRTWLGVPHLDQLRLHGEEGRIEGAGGVGGRVSSSVLAGSLGPRGLEGLQPAPALHDGMTGRGWA